VQSNRPESGAQKGLTAKCSVHGVQVEEFQNLGVVSVERMLWRESSFFIIIYNNGCQFRLIDQLLHTLQPHAPVLIALQGLDLAERSSFFAPLRLKCGGSRLLLGMTGGEQ
jgi:hypothetical protein